MEMLAVGDAFTGNLTRATGGNVGTYAITQGTVALNSSYTITYVGANLTISTRAITVTAAANSRPYDGTTAATATPTITSGTLAAGDAAMFSETYNTKNAGTGKTMTPVVVSIVNSATVSMAANYNVTLSTSANGVISTRAITVTASANTKVYDGTISATATPTITSGTLAAGDVAVFSETYDTKNAGTGKTMTPVVVSIADGAAVNMAANYNVTLSNSANGVIIKKNIKVTAQPFTKVYNGNSASPIAPVVDALQAGDNITTSPVQVYNTPFIGTGKTLTASGLVINDGNNGGNYDVTYITNTNGVITALAVNTSITTNVNTVQYSDLVTFTAKVIGGAPLVPGQPQAALSVTFKVGTQVMGTVNLFVDPANTANLIGTLSNIQMVEPSPFGTSPTGQMAPGSRAVTAVFNSPDVNFNLNTNPASTSITIRQEDATVDYTGDQILATASSATTTAVVTLRVNVSDITVTNAAGDAYPGDIRNAKIMFVNRDANNAPISDWLPVSTLVNAADTKVGTASFAWTVNLGSATDIETTVGIVVDNGYYISKNPSDNIVVTVYKPTGDFITGGGYIVPTLSVGSMKSDVGAKTNFGFNVKFNKSGTNLQGNMNIIFRRTESDNIQHIYQIKANAMQSLGVNATNAKRQTATYVSKTNITDITNPLLPVALGGNKFLHVNMIDNGEPGSKDSISFVLVDGIADPTVMANIIYSSNWVASKTQMMNLSGGNLVVHSGFNLGSPPAAARTATPEITLPVQVVEIPFSVKAWPNPSNNYFTLRVNSTNKEVVELKVYDISGKQVYAAKGAANRLFTFGSMLVSGTYIVEVRQEGKRSVHKLIKN